MGERRYSPHICLSSFLVWRHCCLTPLLSWTTGLWGAASYTQATANLPWIKRCQSSGPQWVFPSRSMSNNVRCVLLSNDITWLSVAMYFEERDRYEELHCRKGRSGSREKWKDSINNILFCSFSLVSRLRLFGANYPHIVSWPEF